MSLVNDIRDLRRYFIGGVNPTGTASSTGDIGQMLKYQIANPNGKGAKTSGAGFFVAPSLATPITITPSAVAWTYGAWVQVIASTSAAIYVVGFVIGAPGVNGQSGQIQIGTGGGGSETGVSEVPIALQTSVGDYPTHHLPAPLPVATGTRVAVRYANDLANAAATTTIRLLCINQSDWVPA